jgi:ATP-binding cassette subfamily B (MDR/TAP) protein 1
VRFVYIGIVFYVAAKFILEYGDDPKNTYITVYILFISAMGAGISYSNAPSVAKAKEAGTTVFQIIDEKSKIDTRHTEGEKTISKGEIEFKKTSFAYPSRAHKVLDSLDLSISANKKIALVGHSGCGKSTIASILLRMYDL